MMTTRRLLAVIATFGCTAFHATAQSSRQLAQASPQPNQQSEGRRHCGPDFAAAAQKPGISEAISTNPQDRLTLKQHQS